MYRDPVFGYAGCAFVGSQVRERGRWWESKGEKELEGKRFPLEIASCPASKRDKWLMELGVVKQKQQLRSSVS